jgi:hypothetical protein
MDFMSFLAAFLAVVSAGVFAAHILDALRSCAIVTAQPSVRQSFAGAPKLPEDYIRSLGAHYRPHKQFRLHRIGPIGSTTWLDPKKVMPIKCGRQA